MSEVIRKWIVTIAFAVLAVAALLHAARGAVPDVQAQDIPAGAVCRLDKGWTLVWNAEEGPQAFMNEQIAAGRTRFIAPQATVMCAW